MKYIPNTPNPISKCTERKIVDNTFVDSLFIKSNLVKINDDKLDNAMASDSKTIRNSNVLISASFGLNRDNANMPSKSRTEFRKIIFLIFAHTVSPLILH